MNGAVEPKIQSPHIRYRDGYKYQLTANCVCNVGIMPKEEINTDYIKLTEEGWLLVRRGYAWDGPSGPTIDTLNFMRGSLVHDALYQLIREKHLPENCRLDADRILRDLCREDGMSAIRAWWVYRGVRLGGGPSATAGKTKPVLEAPKRK